MGMGHGGGWGRGGSLSLLSPWILQKLALTPEQQTQVQAIHAQRRATEQPLFTQLQAIRDEMRKTFYAPGDPDAGTLSSSLQNAAQLQNRIMSDRLAEALEVRAVLMPEQLANAAQLIARIQAMRAQMQDLTAEH
jgi:Spy/CpxP family protein refolding chaperone